MTVFFADVRIYRLPDHHFETLSVEVPADDLQMAARILQAWQAGLRVHPAFDAGMEESLYSTRRRGATYHTLREGSAFILMNLFDASPAR